MINCDGCRSSDVVKAGAIHLSGRIVQRYRCNNCGRHFRIKAPEETGPLSDAYFMAKLGQILEDGARLFGRGDNDQRKEMIECLKESLKLKEDCVV